MGWAKEREKYQTIATSIDPAATVLTKDHWLWSATWYALAIVTFGLIIVGMPKRKYLERYATTLGPWHGYPSTWPALSKRLLVPECRHTPQVGFAGWFVPVFGWFFGRKARAVAGLVPMAIVYGLLLLPLGFCVGRWQLELDADRTAWHWALRNGYSDEYVRERAREFGDKVCGGPYLWAWLKVLGGVKAFDAAADKVIREHAEELATRRRP